MKVALLSDIHGNSVALKNILKEIKKLGIKKLLILGDFVGYYYNHAEVFRLLEGFNWEAVQGNHDSILSDFMLKKQKSIKKYRLSYGSSLDLAFKNLRKDQINLLISLPKKKKLSIAGKSILMCHGSPWKQSDYVYPDAPKEVFRKIANLGYDFVICGNTHYPFIKKLGKTTIINPGSVGQPRDYGSFSSWMVAYFKKNKITLHRTKFQPDKLINQIEEFDPENDYLKKVLLRGKSNYAR